MPNIPLQTQSTNVLMEQFALLVAEVPLRGGWRCVCVGSGGRCVLISTGPRRMLRLCAINLDTPLEVGGAHCVVLSLLIHIVVLILL